MTDYFDYMISLGNDCSVAGSLRKLGYRDASYPFCWNVTSIEFIIKAFETKFKI